MLINREVLSQIDSEIEKVVREVLSVIEGSSGSPSLLEQAYIVGKVANIVGPDRLRKMREGGLQSWIKKNGLVRTKEDQARINTLKESTRKWVASMVDDLSGKIRLEIAIAEEKWAHELVSRDSDGSLRKSLWDDLRNLAKSSLGDLIASVFSGFSSSVDRFMQTELAKYFQIGQTSEIPSEDMVYKVPRLSACEHCLRLHLDSTGTPRLYKLSEVESNSNIGKKAPQWKFVIGPTHPHCYCILYNSKDEPPSQSLELKRAREYSIRANVEKRRAVLERAQRLYDEARLYELE